MYELYVALRWFLLTYLTVLGFLVWALLGFLGGQGLGYMATEGGLLYRLEKEHTVVFNLAMVLLGPVAFTAAVMRVLGWIRRHE